MHRDAASPTLIAQNDQVTAARTPPPVTKWFHSGSFSVLEEFMLPEFSIPMNQSSMGTNRQLRVAYGKLAVS